MSSQSYIQRCFDLARLGQGQVSPNPLVGAVIVYQDRIIGEGYHKRYGSAHAEVEAVNSVPADKRHLLPESTLYVSLEPCCIYGKTPPCTNLIIEQKIPRVVISGLDFTAGVYKESLDILEEAGVEVEIGILEEAGQYLARVRNHFVTRLRPYVVIKYAASADGYIGQSEKQIWLSNPISKRLSHKWRTESSAILCGSNTVLIDDPQLTSRLYPGKKPVRILLDRRGRVSMDARIFDDQAETWIFTSHIDHFANLKATSNFVFQVPEKASVWEAVFHQMNARGMNLLLVEGGAQILQDLIDQDLWDEARIFETEQMLKKGLPAPTFRDFYRQESYSISNDRLVKRFKNGLLR